MTNYMQAEIDSARAEAKDWQDRCLRRAGEVGRLTADLRYWQQQAEHETEAGAKWADWAKRLARQNERLVAALGYLLSPGLTRERAQEQARDLLRQIAEIDFIGP